MLATFALEISPFLSLEDLTSKSMFYVWWLLVNFVTLAKRMTASQYAISCNRNCVVSTHLVLQLFQGLPWMLS